MVSRGPDGDGLWEDGDVSLGHRRLAILDPAHRSDQPMVSASGRYRIVFNGEIYNFRELSRLVVDEAHSLHTTSDTEVLLELFEQRGAAMLPLLRGMFALAIWDTLERRLFVARDAYGIKPLYVATTSAGVIVASTVRALQATGLVSRDPDPWGQATFWLTGSVAEPHTWYAAIRAFPPGHHAWIDRHGMGTPQPWHDVQEAFAHPSGSSRKHAVRDVAAGVRDSVKAHCVSDVPVGLFLSGGIDSGVVGGLVSTLQSGPVTAVTLKFAEFEATQDDETVTAGALARRYGIDHHERLVTQAEFQADSKRILADMDQPSIDGVNTWYASKAMAELGLKVALSGVGGDELFQGYRHMQTVPRLVAGQSALARVPGWSSLANAGVQWQAERSGNPRWQGLVEALRSLPGGWLARRGLFAESELPGLMGDELAHEALRGQGALEWIEGEFARLPRDPRSAMSLIESRMYLRNQLLRDADWASMAHSVELRTPLVDTTLLGVVAPHLSHMRHFSGKRLLSGAVQPSLPDSVLRRPKTGFSIPVQRWLGEAGEHPTRAWARQVAETYR